MSKNYLHVSLIFFLIAFFTGCTMKAPIKTTSTDIIELSNDLSISQIERSIFKAATELGWRLYKVRDGYIIGDYFTAKYSASVDIKYTEYNYKISYNNSKNLKYNGGKILSPYNVWVEELDEKIQETMKQTSLQRK